MQWLKCPMLTNFITVPFLILRSINCLVFEINGNPFTCKIYIYQSYSTQMQYSVQKSKTLPYMCKYIAVILIIIDVYENKCTNLYFLELGLHEVITDFASIRRWM